MNESAISPVYRLTIILLALFAITIAAMSETYCSLQGYSGIINTPNAMILPDGQMTLLYTNQTPPSHIERYPGIRFNNYLLTIGFLPFVEITGRFMNSLSFPAKGPRDLSADIKCGYSFSGFNPWLPSIACGIQDVSGGAVHLSTKYLVVSEEIKRFRVSVGYGFGPSRMEGVFFGAELFLTPYFHFLFDNDGDQASVALRLTTSYTVANIPFSTALMVKNVYREKMPLFTISAAISCDLKNWDLPVDPFRIHRYDSNSDDTTKCSKRFKLSFTLKDISNRLVEHGLQNIAVETEHSTMRICYENNRFGHNEMDALGIVLGTACTMADTLYDTIEVTVLRSGMPVVSVKVIKKEYNRFLKNGNASGIHLFIKTSSSLKKSASFQKKNNVTTGRIRCEISPRLRYFLGTEVGAFDYQLSANLDAFVALWPGGTCAARTVIPIWNTVNLDKEHAFHSYRENTHLNSAGLFQFLNFGYGVTTLFSTGLYTGLYDKKFFSVMDDLRFTNKSGFLRVGILVGYFTREGFYRTTILPYIGIQFPMDINCSITGGVFWEQDTGVDISLSRRFNNIDINLFCKRTKNYYNIFDTYIGAQICLPLTLRKGMKPWFVSISGKNDWQTSLSTRAVTEGSNYISTSCGVIPYRLASLDSDYFNRERLSRRYIQKNLHILRDSWLKYRDL